MAKYTSLDWRTCMNKPLELPPLESCEGQYYEYFGTAPSDRLVEGECSGAGDLSDWSWHEYHEVEDQEGNLIKVMDDDARLAIIKAGWPVFEYPCQ